MSGTTDKVQGAQIIPRFWRRSTFFLAKFPTGLRVTGREFLCTWHVGVAFDGTAAFRAEAMAAVGEHINTTAKAEKVLLCDIEALSPVVEVVGTSLRTGLFGGRRLGAEEPPIGRIASEFLVNSTIQGRAETACEIEA